MKKRMVFLALALVMVLALTACNPFQLLLDQIEGAEASSTSEAEAPSADESEREAPLQPSRPQQASEPDSEPEPEADPGLKVDNLDELDGIWWNMLDEEEGLIYQMKFGEQPGHMMVSAGYSQTDAGFFYGGPYGLAEPGVLACSLQLQTYEEGEQPYTNAMYRLAWTDESKTALSATLVYIDEESGPADGTGFADLFYTIMDVELVLEKQ